MKIFGIGLNKTGTTTLRDCLATLGYRVKGFDRQLTYSAAQGDLAPVLAACDDYDAFQDFPWPLVYRALDERFPGSRFILTTRASSAAWYDSLKRHAYYTGPRRHRGLIYGRATPYFSRRRHIAVYEAHNAAVRAYFRDRPRDLLEICWENGDGWAQLCDWLDVTAPTATLPHANRRREDRLPLRRQLYLNWRTARAVLTQR